MTPEREHAVPLQARPLTTEDRVTAVEARAALERGRPVVLVTPPAPEQAGILWELLPSPGPAPTPPVVIGCADRAAAVEWTDGAPAGRRAHAATGVVRTARLLREGAVDVLAGTAADLTALVTGSALKLEAVPMIAVAWPETLAAHEHAALDALLGEARAARRVVLSWNPSLLEDFLERHAHRALVVGDLPVTESGGPRAGLGPARYAIVPPARRAAALREALDLLDPRRPFIWRGEAIEPSPPDAPDAVLCVRLPTREQFAALGRFAEPVVLITASQLPYLRSIAEPLSPLKLPGATDRAKDRTETLRAELAQLLDGGDLAAELAVLEPLFERFDPAEVAAAVLAMLREGGRGMGGGSAEAAAPAWVKIFVNLGKKDRAGAKDLVGALIKETGVHKSDIGRIEVRETSSLVELSPDVVARVLRELPGVTIKGRRVQARRDRQA